MSNKTAAYKRRRGPALTTLFKEARKRKKLTQQELANLLGTTKTRVSLKERGQEGWDDAYLAALAKVLEVEPASLLKWNPPANMPLATFDELKPENKEKVIDYIMMIRTNEKMTEPNDA